MRKEQIHFWEKISFNTFQVALKVHEISEMNMNDDTRESVKIVRKNQTVKNFLLLESHLRFVANFCDRN